MLDKVLAGLETRYVSKGVSRFIFELLAFGFKQAYACLFGGLMLLLLLSTFMFYPNDAPIARYDAITLGAVVIQCVMLATRLETFDEAKVIFAFHIVGTLMEVFKTHVGSWIYPEPSVLRIADVPLFSGFMYACVGSYLARIWRIFDFSFDRWPPVWMQVALGVAAYLNFFTHHYTLDIRNVLFIAAALLYGACTVHYRPFHRRWKMPLLLGLLLVALFIWIAENAATYARAWSYPDQAEGWRVVSLAKLGSWFLLMQLSFAMVAALHGSRTATSSSVRSSRRSPRGSLPS